MYYNQVKEAVSLELLSPVDKLKNGGGFES